MALPYSHLLFMHLTSSSTLLTEYPYDQLCSISMIARAFLCRADMLLHTCSRLTVHCPLSLVTEYPIVDDTVSLLILFIHACISTNYRPSRPLARCAVHLLKLQHPSLHYTAPCRGRSRFRLPEERICTGTRFWYSARHSMDSSKTRSFSSVCPIIIRSRFTM